MFAKNSERRSFRRFRVDPLICMTVPPTDAMCVLRNVSLGGALLLSQLPPAVGSAVEVEFKEEPLDGYRLLGTVVRHQSGRHRGFAVNFGIPHPRLLRSVYHLPQVD